jgi:hypothetical protein
MSTLRLIAYPARALRYTTVHGQPPSLTRGGHGGTHPINTVGLILQNFVTYSYMHTLPDPTIRLRKQENACAQTSCLLWWSIWHTLCRCLVAMVRTRFVGCWRSLILSYSCPVCRSAIMFTGINLEAFITHDIDIFVVLS